MKKKNYQGHGQKLIIDWINFISTLKMVQLFSLDIAHFLIRYVKASLVSLTPTPASPITCKAKIA